jgi:hypothetical protein
MEKRNHNPSNEPAIKADLSALKIEIIAAVKDSVQGLATQETVSAVRRPRLRRQKASPSSRDS